MSEVFVLNGQTIILCSKMDQVPGALVAEHIQPLNLPRPDSKFSERIVRANVGWYFYRQLLNQELISFCLIGRMTRRPCPVSPCTRTTVPGEPVENPSPLDDAFFSTDSETSIAYNSVLRTIISRIDSMGIGRKDLAYALAGSIGLESHKNMRPDPQVYERILEFMWYVTNVSRVPKLIVDADLFEFLVRFYELIGAERPFVASISVATKV